MKLTKRIATIGSAMVMAVSMMSIGASAYEARDSWDVKLGTNIPTSVGVPTCTCNILTYGGGYQTYCASIYGSNDRYVNVTIGSSVSYYITTTGLSETKNLNTWLNEITVKFEAKSTSKNCYANGTVGYAK